MYVKLRLERIAALAAGLLAVAAAAPHLAAAGSPRVVDRGVVQAVTERRIVLRELDGSLVSLAIGPATRVRVNGSPAPLEAVRPGFVAVVIHEGDEPARIVRAFGKVTVTDRGIVRALRRTAISLRTAPGSVVEIALTPATRFRRGGAPVPRRAARAGARVAVVHREGGAAITVKVLQPAP